MKEVKKITCPNNHRFTAQKEEKTFRMLKRKGRSTLFCPECKVAIRNVICAAENCGKCVPPWSPCENCGADPLVSKGPC